MRTSTIEIGVGLLMLAELIAMLVLALNVSGLTMAKRDSYYTLYATFENIGGLTVRSKVTVAGVTIGRVTGIELDMDTFSGVVAMQIEEGYALAPDRPGHGVALDWDALQSCRA